jgi:hypothetical protein
VFNPTLFALKRLARRRLHRPATLKADRWDAPMFWITFIGVVIVATSTAVTAYQAYLSQLALKSNLSHERAWLKVEAVSARPYVVRQGGRLQFMVRASFANVGGIPAKSANAEADFYEGVSTPSPEGINALCEHKTFESGGLSLFPGQESHQPLDASADVPPPVFTESDPIFPNMYFTICATYRSGDDPAVHHTVTVYEITLRPATRAPDGRIYRFPADLSETPIESTAD